MRTVALISVLCLAAAPAMAGEPDGLVLPPGFHATVVAAGLGSMTRHMAFGDASHLYVSTNQRKPDGPNSGIIALHLDGHHQVDQTQHFTDIDNGTAIAVHDGALYAASHDTLYRIPLSGGALTSQAKPEVVVSDVPRRPALAFDDAGGLYLAVGGSGNRCVPKGTPRGAPAKGLDPCPYLANQAGVWRFSANKRDQKFSSGEHFATGIRDTDAMAWSPRDHALYVVMFGRDRAETAWPHLISSAEAEHIADEMFKVSKGTDMGWPYTYYDSAKHVRLLAPEYGGKGNTVVADSKYATPVAAFHAKVAPIGIAFYAAHQFPAKYQGGAFIAFHGAAGCNSEGFDGGYDVMFVPMNKSGKTGKPEVFASGFAGPTHQDLCGKRAAYRPVDVAVGPGGALYVADSQKGRIWRITYGSNG